MAPERPRAELFEPDGSGGYSSAGHGGVVGEAKRPEWTPPRDLPTTGASPLGEGEAAESRRRPAARTLQPPPHLASPAEQSRAIAETVVGSFVDRLTAEARRRGGTLSVEDLQRMNDSFQRQTEALQQVFEQSFELYVKARERANWDQARSYSFDRLVVKTFSHLFADGNDLDSRSLSRRMLPGFFMALSMMVGPDVVDGYQDRAGAIAERIRQVRGETFTWEDVYTDREARSLILESQAAMARTFSDFGKRTRWLRDLINGHLTPVDVGTDEDATKWQLGEPALNRFLRALFTDLGRALVDPDRRSALVRLHGAEAVDDLAAVIQRIGA